MKEFLDRLIDEVMSYILFGRSLTTVERVMRGEIKPGPELARRIGQLTGIVFNP